MADEPSTAEARTALTTIFDQLNRPLRDLRLSITDRCNFRCTYCLPASVDFSKDALTPSEVASIAAAFQQLGVRKLRVTGGEPLVRRDVVEIVEKLRFLEFPDLCMTTNGSLLGKLATSLADAGLMRVTVSLDALDQPTFERISGTGYSVHQVVQGIDAARKAGLLPLKVNAVLKRGVNDHVILPMAEWAEREGLELRFIEYMDVGHSNDWRPELVVTAEEVVTRLRSRWDLLPLARTSASDTAERYSLGGGGAIIGTVASISKPFCGDCNRARVSAKGHVHSCLFAAQALDLGTLLQTGQPLEPALNKFWSLRGDRYSEERSQHNSARDSSLPSASRVFGTSVPAARLVRRHRGPEMSAIGG